MHRNVHKTFKKKLNEKNSNKEATIQAPSIYCFVWKNWNNSYTGEFLSTDKKAKYGWTK